MAFPIYSWLIRAIEGTPFSHVYVWHETKYNVPIVYQASGHAVNFMSGNLFREHNEVVHEFAFEVSDLAFESYMLFALLNVGRPYSLKQAFGILLMRLFDLKRNPFSNGRALFICTELVAVILNELMKFKLEENFYDRAGPMDIYKICERAAKGELP